MSEARNRGNTNPQSRMVSWGVIGFILLILLIWFGNSAFKTIDPGERGVLFRPFNGGIDRENIYQPGFHVIAPWNDLIKYDVREQQIEEEMEVLSSQGLNIRVDVTVRINPLYDKIGEIHEKFGPDYIQRLVIPEVRSAVREQIGQFTPEELYSTRRNEVQKLIQDHLAKALNNNYVDLKATLIRDIELPEKVRTAIETKLEAEQSALKYEYILNQERQEAERKTIEAQAKADANQILNASLTDKILKDKGIEATLELAKSPNSKVVIVGGGGDGLPLILGGGSQ